MTYRKKLIEVSLPLEAINVASLCEKSIGVDTLPRYICGGLKDGYSYK